MRSVLLRQLLFALSCCKRILCVLGRLLDGAVLGYRRGIFGI